MKNTLNPVMTVIRTIVPPVLLCCSGFLLGVVWFTLMGDVLADGITGIIPPAILSDIVTFYRVMFGQLTWLIKVFFLLSLTSMTLQLFIREIPWYLRLTVFITNAPTIFMAVFIVIPMVDRLILNTGTPETQSQLVRSIHTGHLISLSCVCLMIVLQSIIVIYLRRKAEKK